MHSPRRSRFRACPGESDTRSRVPPRKRERLMLSSERLFSETLSPSHAIARAFAAPWNESLATKSSVLVINHGLRAPSGPFGPVTNCVTRDARQIIAATPARNQRRLSASGGCFMTRRLDGFWYRFAGIYGDFFFTFNDTEIFLCLLDT